MDDNDVPCVFLLFLCALCVLFACYFFVVDLDRGWLPDNNACLWGCGVHISQHKSGDCCRLCTFVCGVDELLSP